MFGINIMIFCKISHPILILKIQFTVFVMGSHSVTNPIQQIINIKPEGCIVHSHVPSRSDHLWINNRWFSVWCKCGT